MIVAYAVDVREVSLVLGRYGVGVGEKSDLVVECGHRCGTADSEQSQQQAYSHVDFVVCHSGRSVS